MYMHYIHSNLCAYTRVHTCMIACIYACIHILMRTLTCSHMHMYMHICSRGRGTQYFTTPFTEVVDMVLTSPWWLSCFW